MQRCETYSRSSTASLYILMHDISVIARHKGRYEHILNIPTNDWYGHFTEHYISKLNLQLNALIHVAYLCNIY